MNKKGFTLIELLAVIVLLAVILTITVPTITGLINGATKSAFKEDASMVLKAIEYEFLKNDNFDVTTINKTTVTSTLKLSNENYESVKVTMNQNQAHVVISGTNKWAGLVAYGTIKNMTVVSKDEYDVEAPILTLLGSSTMVIDKNSSYADAGATAIDDKDGDITSNIEMISTVNTSIEGEYNVTYNVSDTLGNAATPITRTVYVMEFDYAFNYTGAPQTWTAPRTGTYKIELWGAEGGMIDGYDPSFAAGKGSYTKGEITLNSGQSLNIFVGGKGQNGSQNSNFTPSGGWNGGGNGADSSYTLPAVGSEYVASAGGGATDIRIGGMTLINRIMVAGGGGGRAYYPSAAGNGGTLTGQNSGNSDGHLGGALGSSGGTQTSGGIAYSGSTTGNGIVTIGHSGSFGLGGHGIKDVHAGGGGGGGYYGGGSGSGGNASTGGSSGAGGSSFISGYAGCNAVNVSGTHTGQPNHFSGFIFTNNVMQAGARTGNGTVKITYMP